MTALVWTTYLLAAVATYHRVRTWRPTWELRAELVSVAVGLALVAAVSVLIVETVGATEWTPPDWGRGMFGPKRVPVA